MTAGMPRSDDRSASPAAKNLYLNFRDQFTAGITDLCAASLASDPEGARTDVRPEISARIALLEK